MSEINLDAITQVTFFKRDELTTDLICCAVRCDGADIIFHEDMPGWDDLIRQLERLPQFRTEWFAEVSQPPFATSETVAFIRR
jgi:hypothetical protein